MDIIRSAEQQFGLITTEQLRQAGVSDRAICDRVKTGRLVREARGVYRLPGGAHTFERGLLVAHLSFPRSTVSHRSAATLWSIAGVRYVRPELIVPSGTKPRSRNAITYQRLLAQDDATQKGPFRLTRPARTLIDLATLLTEEQLEIAVDDSVTRRITTLVDLQQRILGDQRGVRGVKALRVIVEDRSVNGVPGSNLETRAVRALKKDRLPRPNSQFVVRRSDGSFVGRVDLAYPDIRLAIELDGDTYHATKAQRREDRERQNQLVEAGYDVLRFDDAAVRSGVFCASLRRYLRNA